MLSCTPEYLSCIHHNHEKPNSAVKKVARQFDRGTRGRFLRKAVPRHGGGGGVLIHGNFDSTCKQQRFMHDCKLVTSTEKYPWTPGPLDG